MSRAVGLCKYCGQPPLKGRAECSTCNNFKRSVEGSKFYEANKAAIDAGQMKLHSEVKEIPQLIRQANGRVKRPGSPGSVRSGGSGLPPPKPGGLPLPASLEPGLPLPAGAVPSPASLPSGGQPIQVVDRPVMVVDAAASEQLRKLSGATEALRSSVEEQGTTLVAVQESLETIQEDLTAQAGDISKLKADLAAAGATTAAQYQGHDTQLARIETTLGTLQREIGALTASMGSFGGRFQTIEAELKQMGQDVSKLHGVVDGRFNQWATGVQEYLDKKFNEQQAWLATEFQAWQVHARKLEQAHRGVDISAQGLIMPLPVAQHPTPYR